MTRSSVVVMLAAMSLTACESARGQPPPVLPADTVALVGGRPITSADLDRQLQRVPPALRSHYAQPAGRTDLLETVVGTELLALEAERLGIHQDPEYQQAAKQLLVRHLLQYAIDPIPDHQDRDRRMQALLAETRARFKVQILEPQRGSRATSQSLVTIGLR